MKIDGIQCFFNEINQILLFSRRPRHDGFQPRQEDGAQGGDADREVGRAGV